MWLREGRGHAHCFSDPALDMPGAMHVVMTNVTVAGCLLRTSHSAHSVPSAYFLPAASLAVAWWWPALGNIDY